MAARDIGSGDMESVALAVDGIVQERSVKHELKIQIPPAIHEAELLQRLYGTTIQAREAYGF
jgi:hypothetical protein